MQRRSFFRLAAALGLALAGLIPSTSFADEGGTRVALRLPDSGAKFPDAEKLVGALEAAGGHKQVRVNEDVVNGKAELTLELWGQWAPGAEIPKLLRQAFPELARADIQVTAIDAASKPEFNRDPDFPADAGHVRRIIKKVVLDR